MKHRYIENLSKRDARIKVHNMGWTNPRRRSITNTSSSEFDSGSEKNKSPTRNNNNNLPLRRRDPLDDVEDDESNHSSDDMETSSMNDLGLLFQRDRSSNVINQKKFEFVSVKILQFIWKPPCLCCYILNSVLF